MPILTFVRKTGFLSLILGLRDENENRKRDNITRNFSKNLIYNSIIIIVKRKELLSELTKFILFSLMNGCGVTLQQ